MPFGEGESVRVRILQDGDEWVGTLEASGEPRLFRDATCESVLSALAAATAVWLDGPNRVGILGPAPREPAPEPQTTPAPPPSNDIRLVVESNNPELSLHLETNTGVGSVGAVFYERLCLTPCEVRIPRGDHRFGWTVPPMRTPNLNDEVVRMQRDQRLRIVERYNAGVARAGFALMITAILAPITPIVLGYKNDNKLAGWLTGGAIYLAFTIAGGTLIRMGERQVEMNFEPI